MIYGKEIKKSNGITEGVIRLTPEEVERLENGEELVRILRSAKGNFELSVKITPEEQESKCLNALMIRHKG